MSKKDKQPKGITSEGWGATRDGKFLYYYENTTHTGKHVTAEWRDDLQQATVLYSMIPFTTRRQHDLEGLSYVPVEVTRFVQLIAK